MSSATSLHALLDRARRAGVELWAEGGRLRFRAPAGALDDEIRQALRERKNELVRLLQREAERVVQTGPIAANQQGLWLIHQVSPESPAYNLAFSARIFGAVEVGVLREAFQVLVDRHEALRTAYAVGSNGEPERRVYGRASFELREERVSGDSDRLRTAVESAYREPFHLESPPLVRGHLFTGPGNEQILLFVGHHLAIDGQSLFLLLREFFQVYASLADSDSLPPTGHGADFGDFVEWQQRMLSADPPGASYWRDALSPPPPQLEIPADRPRSAATGSRGGTVSFHVGEEVATAIRNLARTHGATEFTALLAAWAVWLYRVTGVTDVTIGTPVQGRPSVRFQETVGDFVNILPLRVWFDQDMSFGSLLDDVRTTVLEGMAHQDYPLPLMAASTAGGAGPPFETMFVLQDFKRFGPLAEFLLSDEEGTQTFGPLRLAPYPLAQQEGQFPLSLDAWAKQGGWTFNCKYDSSLFDRATVERRMEEFVTLLRGIAQDPDTVLADLPIVPPSEMALLQEWNATDCPVPGGTVVDLIEAQASRIPDNLALLAGRNSRTYSTLVTEAQRIGAALRERGVVAGDRVGVLAGRDERLVEVLLGVMGIGAAYVPMDPRYPAARLRQMAEDSGIVALVVGERIASPPDVAAPVLNLSNATLPGPQPFEGHDPESTAYVIYTSGSTGRPKGVEIPHRAVVNFLASMADQPGVSHEDVLLAVTTISFDIAVLELFLPLTTGARVVIATEDETRDGNRLGELIDAEDVTVLQATPATWKLLVAAGWPGNPDLKALCGGEALPEDLAEDLLARSGELWNLYGPTEATVWSSVQRITQGEPVGIGRPIANTRIYIVDTRGKRVPIGVPGELWIGGAGVARGYLGRPDLTAERFLPSPFGDDDRLYRTGDRARFLPDGSLDYLGRLDHQVKVRGFRVEPGEIETRLRAHNRVRQAVVVARDDRLVAYLVVTDGSGATGESAAPVDSETMRGWVAEALPAYMVPSVFVTLPTMPLTPNGKIDRSALPDPRGEEKNTYSPPETEIERELARIWKEVLDVTQVGRDDDFFRLGGHSLLVPATMLRIQQRFGVEVEVGELFQAPVLQDLSLRVQVALVRSLGPSESSSGDATETLVF